MDENDTNKVALICGAGGGGIGSATTYLLATAGAKIVAVDQNASLIAETVAVVEQLGGTCYPIIADLTDPAQRSTVVADAVRLAGRIDLVANVAGGMKGNQWGPFEGTPDAVFRDVMALNFEYVFTICRDAMKVMVAQGTGGGIVNVSSVAALPSAPYHAPYGAAKAAVIALTHSIAVEGGPHRIRANVVVPGATKTARAARLIGDAITTRQKVWAPLERPVEPQEVGQAIAFFLSDRASGITGQVLAVDAGITNLSAIGPLDYFRSRASW